MSNRPRESTWASTILSDIATVVRGRVSPADHSELPFIGMDGVEAHTMRLLQTVPAATMKSAAVHFRPGDVLYGRLRPYLNKVLAPDFEGLASAEFIPLTPPGGVATKFVQYRINAADFVAFASGLDEGDRPRVDYDQIGAFEIELPPPEEQQRIVQAVESYLTRLDDTVATLERVQRNLKRYRASVLKKAMEGRAVSTEAQLARADGRGYEPASMLLDRILIERRRLWEEEELAKLKSKGKVPKGGRWKAKYLEPVAPEINELRELPEGWCWATVDQLAYVGTGATPKRGHAPYWSGGDIPWVTSAVVNERPVRAPSEYVTSAALKEANLTLYPPGTLLIAMYGEGKTRGRATVLGIASTTNQALAALELPAVSRVLSAWFLAFFEHNYLELRKSAFGGVQPNLNLGIIRAICVPIPPLQEQERIVNAIDMAISIGDALLPSIAFSARKAARVRQCILKWAFEGRLVDPDPTEEPASVLLERIRADRVTDNGRPQRRPRQTRKASAKK